MLIAQDISHWQLQFSIPAKDLLGFEHEPENEKQREKVHHIDTAVSKFSNVVSVMGGCNVVSQNIDIPHAERHSADNEHEHLNEHHDHEGHQHQNISLEYQLSCSEELTGITVTLFKLAPSLQALKVQWINDTGQGMTDVTPQAATINW